jgi:hypothetical protein
MVFLVLQYYAYIKTNLESVSYYIGLLEVRVPLNTRMDVTNNS